MQPLKLPAEKLLHVKSPYLKDKSPSYDEIWYTTPYLERDDNRVNKYVSHIENRFLSITQLLTCPILVKFYKNCCHCCRIDHNWSFDEDMADYGCEVHSFDPRSAEQHLYRIEYT